MGLVQFVFNDKFADEPYLIGCFGRVKWTSSELKAGTYKVTAQGLPAEGNNSILTSQIFDLIHIVLGKNLRPFD